MVQSYHHHYPTVNSRRTSITTFLASIVFALTFATFCQGFSSSFSPKSIRRTLWLHKSPFTISTLRPSSSRLFLQLSSRMSPVLRSHSNNVSKGDIGKNTDPQNPASSSLKKRAAASTDTSKSHVTKKPRDTTKSTTPKQPRQRKGNGPHLTKFLQVYKGLEDWMLPIFRNVQAKYHPNVVLYPGSSRHITASLIFDNVTYIDMDKKVGEFFQDDRVREWVSTHKEYSGPIVGMKCFAKNFESSSMGIPLQSADLLISASAGIVSRPCAKYLKPGGYFLVSDAHFDARQVYVDSFYAATDKPKKKQTSHESFQLVAVIGNDGSIDCSKNSLQGHFTTTKGDILTLEQVEESKTKPKARRSFKLQKEGMFYLFQKQAQQQPQQEDNSTTGI